MNVERQHKCQTCNRGFLSARALGDHQRDSHTTKVASAAGTGNAKLPGVVLHSRGSRKTRVLGERRRVGGYPAGAVAPTSGGVAVPELTHKLSLEDRLFLDNYLSPCDERAGPSSGSKIPDGSLPNSGINGFREVFNVAPPFALPADGGAIGGPLWSLIVMKLPTIREAIYLIATNTRDDLSHQDQLDIAQAYNTGKVPVFPDWGKVNNSENLKISRVVWSQLKQTSNLRTLFKQVRIAKSGFTTFHNTPDLYNQGMIIAAQWNCDNSYRGLVSTVSPEVLPTESLGLSWKSDSTGYLSGVLQTPTGSYPLVKAGTATTDPLSTVNISVSSMGLVGAVGFSLDQTIPLVAGGLFRVEMTTTGQAAFIHLISVGRDGVTHNAVFQKPNISSGTIQLIWAVSTLQEVSSGVDIELPPLDTQTIVQSTPKAIVFPMKQFNGAYTVLRSWEPVFSMQEADNLGPVQWSRKGAVNTTGISGRDHDLVDLNFGTAVQAIMGISLAASVTVKVIQDVEFVAGDGSPWQGFMNPNVSVDPQVISVARAISLDQPFAFPQTYNSMGSLLDGVESLLSRVPIIGNVVPLVSKVVRSLFPAAAGNNPHAEIRGEDVAQLVEKLVRALGLVK